MTNQRRITWRLEERSQSTFCQISETADLRSRFLLNIEGRILSLNKIVSHFYFSCGEYIHSYTLSTENSFSDMPFQVYFKSDE